MSLGSDNTSFPDSFLTLFEHFWLISHVSDVSVSALTMILEVLPILSHLLLNFIFLSLLRIGIEWEFSSFFLGCKLFDDRGYIIKTPFVILSYTVFHVGLQMFFTFDSLFPLAHRSLQFGLVTPAYSICHYSSCLSSHHSILVQVIFLGLCVLAYLIAQDFI